MSLLLDFRKYLYIFFSRSKVTSKKSTVFRFVSTTIDNPHLLNTLTIAFFFLSISDLDMFLKIRRPSSRYNPTSNLLVILANLLCIQVPTNLHISAQSKQPIGTSKSSSPLFLMQSVVPSKRRVFLVYIMIGKSSSEIWINCLANIYIYIYIYIYTPSYLILYHIFNI